MTTTPSTGKRPTYTPAQQRAILAPGHVLLEAGAGSGKTTTLVGKILHAMGAEVVPGERVATPCELGAIAAITFTTAAAADLKRSLRRRLRDEAGRTGDRRWHRAAYEVDRARIGTIHGFCSQLLREFGLRTGLDPSFRVLETGEALVLREECVRQTVLAALRENDGEAETLVFAVGPDAVMKMVGDAVGAGDATRRAHERWCDADGPRLAALRTRVLELGGQWHAAHDDGAARLGAVALRLALDARRRLDERLDREGALDYDALIYRARDLLRDRPDVLGTLRRRLAWLFIDEFQDTDPAQRDIAYLLCGVEERLSALGPRLRGGKRWTLDVERETALPFRPTSNVQRCSSVCESRVPRAESGLPPSLCIVGDPKQSIYGFRRADVTLWNQVARDFAAIGADVVPLDANFRSRAPILGLVNATFGALMPPADDASVAAPDYEVRYRALTASRSYAGDDGIVELLALPADGTADVRRDEEARRIARRIRTMVDDGERLVWDGKGEPASVSWRDVALLFRSRTEVRRYEAELRRLGVPCYAAAGDGFYATREVRDLVLLLRALLDAHDDLAWIGLLRSPLVGLTDDALFRLRHERPGVPFARALEPSPGTGQAVELPGEDGEALTRARTWLAELATLRDRVSNAALLERALERTGYPAYLLFHAGGDVALANVRKLVHIADGRPGESLAAFVRHLEEQAVSSAREGDAPLHTAGEDVVVLTTVHGAKGLEWPVVFLCDLDRELGAGITPPPLLYDAEWGIGLKIESQPDEEEDGGTPACGAYERLRSLADERDRAEEKRVWYVAATRARDRLVLCARAPQHPSADATPSARGRKRAAPAGAEEAEAPKAPKPTAARWLLAGTRVEGDTLSYADERWAVTSWTGPVTSVVRDDFAVVDPPRPPEWAAVVAATARQPDVLRRTSATTPVAPLFRRSATEVMVLARSPEEHRRNYLLGLRDVAAGPRSARQDGSAASGPPAGIELDARTTGDIVHAVMEIDAEALDRDLDAVLEREITHRLGDELAGLVSSEARARLRRLVEETRAHAAVSRLLGAELVEHELPFTWFVGAPAGCAPSVFHGAMDLVARVGGTLEVLDFKTHRITAGMEAATAATYDLQRDLYALALSDVVEAPAAFCFFFPETGGEVRTRVEADAIAVARAALLARLYPDAGAPNAAPGGDA